VVPPDADTMTAIRGRRPRRLSRPAIQVGALIRAEATAWLRPFPPATIGQAPRDDDSTAAHQRTDPALIPAMKRRWRAKNSAMIGMDSITPAPATSA
jgi:hypothetical protein